MASGLTTIVMTMFLRIYSETSDYRPITIYRPLCPPRYCALGDYAQATNPEEPNYGVTICLKHDNPRLLKTPMRFRQIWSSEGGAIDDEEGRDGSGLSSGSGNGGSASSGDARSKVLAFWRAVPPSNQFVSLGDVATTSYEQPNRTEFCVVHNSVVVTAKHGSRLWLEHSGAVSLWAHAPSHEYINLETFVTNDYNTQPHESYFRSLLPEAFSPVPKGSLMRRHLHARDLNLLLRDPTGKDGYEDLSVYVPQPPIGFSAVGHYAERGLEKSKAAHVMVVKQVGTSALLAPPVTYRKIWDSYAVKVLFAFWRPIPPPGYHCLGDVATVGAQTIPSTNSIVCLHWSLVKRGGRGYRVWWNRVSPLKGSSPKADDVTVWRVGVVKECEAPNTFVANLEYVTPSSERLLFNCLVSNTVEV